MFGNWIITLVSMTLECTHWCLAFICFAWFSDFENISCFSGSCLYVNFSTTIRATLMIFSTYPYLCMNPWMQSSVTLPYISQFIDFVKFHHFQSVLLQSWYLIDTSEHESLDAVICFWPWPMFYGLVTNCSPLDHFLSNCHWCNSDTL